MALIRKPLFKPAQRVIQQQIIPRQKPSPAVSFPSPVSPAPGYPGQKQGLSFDQARNFNSSQFKTKGFTFNLAAGVVSSFPINISGFARCIKGLAAHSITFWNDDANAPQDVTFLINEEQALDDHPFTMLDVKYLQMPYYPFERLVSGNDSIELSVNNPNAAQDIAFLIYYI